MLLGLGCSAECPIRAERTTGPIDGDGMELPGDTAGRNPDGQLGVAQRQKMMQSGSKQEAIYQWQNGRGLQRWRRRCSRVCETATR